MCARPRDVAARLGRKRARIHRAARPPRRAARSLGAPRLADQHAALDCVRVRPRSGSVRARLAGCPSATVVFYLHSRSGAGERGRSNGLARISASPCSCVLSGFAMSHSHAAPLYLPCAPGRARTGGSGGAHLLDSASIVAAGRLAGLAAGGPSGGSGSLVVLGPLISWLGCWPLHSPLARWLAGSLASGSRARALKLAPEISLGRSRHPTGATLESSLGFH